MEEVVIKQYVTFEMDNQNYGIDIQSVQIIERMKSIMRVPKAPYYVRGVMNLRGEIIPVIDIRRLFSMDFQEETDNTRIIIITMEDSMVGLIVDKVKAVVELEATQIEGVSNMQGKVDSNYIVGVGKMKFGEDIITIIHHVKLIETAFNIQE
ncbi:chemotaxis protein CheW [Candidatus Epulonipiscium fishelsonii]|uniref:Chemotaxis protein CheW n=1 Tax=Candidatus Epulonipiscium fishelsonii TaxID=77094 RepID=A0ACC8XDZ8_9FIRM|nr:chemotaxis protein CheW [Epulopiscium sp. SCG-B05WGA-EpuloA1]ONI41003.1 chemotaxis protein CheW [Epulopiscium sp. SCG-B11WGA-EpuloA1]ONI47430.1 chemotaxis protein CheW [Epulopiscium sp. SCG-C06WGA-EpuloA1]